MNRTISVKIAVADNKNYLSFMETCSEIFNLYVDWAFKNKTYSKQKCHEALYFVLREQYPEIPSGMIQTIRDVAMEAVKAQKFKRKPYKKKHSSIRYDLRTMTMRGNLLSFSDGKHRSKCLINIPDHFKDIFENWKFCGGSIIYEKGQKQFYANLIYKTETPEPIVNEEVIGIDRGIYNLVVLSNGEIIDSKIVRDHQRKCLYNRKKIQAKGTKSAKKKLRKLSGSEMRFSKDINHCISKKLANYNCGTFVLEDLKGIRKQKSYSKKANKWLSSWPFFQFDMFLTYKCESVGKKVVKVDPKYTSQQCSNCGKIEKSSRNKSIYHCIHCGHHQHADINAAINIKNKYILSVTSKMSTEQAAVNQPIVSVAI